MEGQSVAYRTSVRTVVDVAALVGRADATAANVTDAEISTSIRAAVLTFTDAAWAWRRTVGWTGLSDYHKRVWSVVPDAELAMYETPADSSVADHQIIAHPILNAWWPQRLRDAEDRLRQTAMHLPALAEHARSSHRQP